MPFSVKMSLGSECPIAFEGWIENAFGKYVPKGTAFARGSVPNGPGFIITCFPVFLSSAEPLDPGSIIEPGGCIAYGSANGEDIPYGQPYSAFVKELTTQVVPENGLGFRLRVL
jgi:hypothetical protein